MSRLDAVRSAWGGCTAEEKWHVVSDLLLDLLDGPPDHEVPIRIPDGPTWAYLCPAGRFGDLTAPPGRVEELLARDLDPVPPAAGEVR